MATPAQIRANRLNAQKSTGPRSAEGKGTSRFNALQHGMDAASLVIPGEDPAELEELVHEYRRQFQPGSPFEAYLVDTLVQADWNRRRLARIEAQLLRLQLEEQAAACPPGSQPPRNPLGAVYREDAAAGQALQRVFRRREAAERSFFRALAELRRLARECPPHDDTAIDRAPLDAAGPVSRPPLPPTPPGEPPAMAPIGFVPPPPAPRSAVPPLTPPRGLPAPSRSAPAACR